MVHVRSPAYFFSWARSLPRDAFARRSGRKENSYVSGGTLKLTARQEDWIGQPFTSARIRTRGKGDWLYGARRRSLR